MGFRRLSATGKLLALLGAALTNSAVFAQGTILFTTFSSSNQVNVPIFAPGSITDGIGTIPGMKAQLFLLLGSGASRVYVPLLPATTFNTNNPTAARYVLVPKEPVAVPNVPAGEQATIVMRIWNFNSYEASSLRGESNPLVVTLGGTLADGNILPPATLAGMIFSFPLTPQSKFLSILEITVTELEVQLSVYGWQMGNWEPGLPPVSYVVETSADFVAWNPALTNSQASRAVTNVAVPLDPISSKTFYRLR